MLRPFAIILILVAPIFVSADNSRLNSEKVVTTKSHSPQYYLNTYRAFAKVAWSGYIPKVHLVTPANVGADGGPKNLFDPDNGYRDQYKRIWGK